MFSCVAPCEIKHQHFIEHLKCVLLRSPTAPLGALLADGGSGSHHHLLLKSSDLDAALLLAMLGSRGG